MWSAISAASRFGISLVPPMNRVVCAPPSDSANSSDVTPQVWMVNSRCRKDTSAVGTARIPTVQISSRLRATGESPCASYQAPAVMASHSSARGACQGASTGTSAASTSSRRSTQFEFLQLRLRTGRETRSPATHQSRPGRRRSRPRRTAGRSRPRVLRPAGTSVGACRRSTGRRVRPARPGSTSSVRMRPPTRSSASRTSGVSPASSTFRAAIMPGEPGTDDDDVRFHGVVDVPWWPPSHAAATAG